MPYSTYKTLKNLTDSFGAAQNNVVGLNSHHVLYESEINSIKNINYPTIVTEVPNSSIENVNRGMETFEVVVFVLKQELTRLDNQAQLYDDCLALFDAWLSELMTQRGGEYILIKDSIDIERLQKFGNDSSYGCRVEFEMLVPSVIVGSSNPLTLDSENLYAYYDSTHDVTLSVYSGVTWGMHSGSKTGLTNITSSNLADDELFTAYSTVSDSFIFEPMYGQYNHAATLEVKDVSFSGSNWTISMLVRVDNFDGEFSSCFFSTAKIIDSTFNVVTSPAYIRMELIHSGNDTYPNGIVLRTQGAGQPNEGNLSENNIAKHENGNILNAGDIIGEEFTPITFVNDATQGKVFIHLGNEPVAEISICDNSSWTDKHMWIMGAAHVSGSLSYTTNYMANSELKDLILYSGVKSRQQCLNINKYLYRRANV